MVKNLKKLENEIDILLAKYQSLENIQAELELHILNLNQWISKWKQIYAIVRKKSYTLNETIALANVFGCTVVKVGTKYNFVNNSKILLF